MKPDLLNDTLRESNYAEFRQALAEKVIGEARHRLRRRQISWLAIAASAALMTGLLFYQPRQQPQITVSGQEKTPTLRTVPLEPEQILATKATSLLIIETQSAVTLTFETTHINKVEAISDVELLATFAKRPTGLILAKEGKRLLFLDPADVKRFMSSN